MARYEIVASLSGTQARYLYEDAEKALRKTRSLAGKAVPFKLTRGNGEFLTIDELERLASD